jgi:circadian clock protein KaiC
MMSGGDTIERLPTGISGFDQVAIGGLPEGRATLVAGTTGSGKTLFAVEFLVRGITRFGEPGVFVTFEETTTEIRRNAASLGFDIEHWENEGMWAFVDASPYTGEETETVGDYDFGALLARIGHAVRRVGAKRLSMDSLGAVFARFNDVGTVRRELFRISTALKSLKVTSVVTSERTAEYNGVSRYDIEEFVLDSVVILRNVLQHERRRRTVEVVKLRGGAHRTGEWLFTIDSQDGIVIIPLTFLVPHKPASRVRVSIGNSRLDEMLGGGLFKDALALVAGPIGAGKTLASLHFADAAYREGRRCLYYTFDETPEQLIRSAAGWGLDAEAMVSSGLLKVVAEFPEVASLEDHFLRLTRAVSDFSPDRLVIDTLSSLERIVSPHALVDFVIALGAVLRQHDITTLLTSSPGAQMTPSATPTIATEFASLTDAMILLRYVERAGELQRAIAIVQTRGSAHDQTIRRVTIDTAGMHIGEPYPGISHIIPDAAPLAAAPRWHSEAPQGMNEGTDGA